MAEPPGAAIVLTGEDDTDTTLGARLLADLRDVFADADAMHGETIISALHKISEAPWSDYFGRPVNARDVAKLLKPYGVASVDVKIDGVNRKGYRRDHLHDPWTRYLPPPGGSSRYPSCEPLDQALVDADLTDHGEDA